MGGNDIIEVTIGNEVIPLPREALHEGAKSLWGALQEYVDPADLAPAVAAVLQALQRQGLVSVHSARS